MGDLKHPALIWLKGFLFLVLGLFSAGLLLMQSPDPVVACLLGICVWAFCRFYYFMFYVIEQYVDDGYRFAGLTSFLRYAIRHRATLFRPKATAENKTDNSDNQQTEKNESL